MAEEKITAIGKAASADSLREVLKIIVLIIIISDYGYIIITVKKKYRRQQSFFVSCIELKDLL